MFYRLSGKPIKGTFFYKMNEGSIVDTNRLIDEYYKTIKDKYPDISEREVELICKSPFELLVKLMVHPLLPQLHLKYFGTFRISPTKALKGLIDIEEKWKYGKITPKKYHEYRPLLKNLIDRYEKEGKYNTPSLSRLYNRYFKT
jgi:hypothetical protein